MQKKIIYLNINTTTSLQTLQTLGTLLVHRSSFDYINANTSNVGDFVCLQKVLSIPTRSLFNSLFSIIIPIITLISSLCLFVFFGFSLTPTSAIATALFSSRLHERVLPLVKFPLFRIGGADYTCVQYCLSSSFHNRTC